MGIRQFTFFLFLNWSLFSFTLKAGSNSGQILNPVIWAQEMFGTIPQQALLPEFEDSYGVVFRDINQDGWPDIYVVRFRNLNRLFINQGADSPFEDFTIQSGLGGNLMPYGQQNLELGASGADFDNDGRPDILIAGWGVTTRLFRQENHLLFRDITRESGIHPPIDGNAGIWADVNRDGYLDLFITDEHYRNHFYLNNGRGKFTDLTEAFGFSLQSTSQSAAFADVDLDGFPDLYVCNWFAPDILFRNENGRQFTPVKMDIHHLTTSIKTNGVAFGDIDNDGDPDLIVTDRDGQSRLYRNDISPADTAWNFTDITQSSGISNPYPAYGCLIADLDNNGLQDILFSNIGPNILFLNEGKGYFTRAFKEPVVSASNLENYSTGIAVSDFDRDGDLDVFIASKDTHSVLYRNPLNNGNYLRLHLEGVESNRDAIGSKVWLYREDSAGKAELLGYREISGGSGYLSFNEPVIHFGVTSQSPLWLKIVFPSRKEIVKKDVYAGNVYKISEHTGLRRTALYTVAALKRHIISPVFWFSLLIFLFIFIFIIGFVAFAVRRYQWKPTHTSVFLIGTIILFYIFSLVFTAREMHIILLSQLIAISVFILITFFFMEQIRRIELQRYGYRTVLQEFSQQLIFIKENRELYDRLVKTLQKNLKLSFCAVSELKNKKMTIISAAGQMPEIFGEHPLNEDLRKLIAGQVIISGENIQSILPGELGNISCLIPLSRKEKLFALLLIGHRIDGRELPAEDISLLQILASQAAIAVENNLYIQESKALIQKITEAETREKYVKELEEAHQTLQNLYRELQETQAQLIQSEKMASLGQLVAGVAHELNNPISYVYANMRELQEYITAINQLLTAINSETEKQEISGKLQETLKKIEAEYDLAFIQSDIQSLISESIRGSERVKEVVRNLRNFSRLDEAEFKAVNLHEGLDSTLMLLNNELKNRIAIRKEYGDLPAVYCNPGYINQVFMNILLNASQAIESKGEIRIATRRLNSFVEIEISDTGKGIPPDLLNKIFDPFFTTKPVGKGTGLGLSISYNIIKKHGGTITVESEVDKGTTFRIKLPVGPATA